jgi:hypothetical protein
MEENRDCMEEISSMIANLQRKGLSTAVIMQALVGEAIRVAEVDAANTQVHLDTIAAITQAAAEGTRACTVGRLFHAITQSG